MGSGVNPVEGDDRRGAAVPRLEGVLETVLYYADGEEGEMQHFYREVLGMRPIGSQEGRFLFFRAGRSVFLLFNASHTRRQASPPPHGTTGPGHVCFLAPAGEYEAWKAYLTRQAVKWGGEVAWPGGGRSFYFDDPSGNTLEIADRDIWPP